MSDAKKPPLVLIDHPAETVGETASPRSLSKLDWAAFGLIVAALVLAPLCAATFATLPGTVSDDLLGPLQLIGMPIVATLVALAVAVSVWREWRRPVAIGAAPGLAGASVLLAVWGAVSIVRSPVVGLSLNTLTALLAALCAATLIARLSRDHRALNGFLLTLAAAGTLAAAFGINQYLAYLHAGNPSWRTFGTFVNPDFLAGYLLLTIPLTLAAFVAAGERTARLLLGLGLFLQSAGLLLTGSRAGVGMLVVVLAAWLVLVWRSGAGAGFRKQIGIGLTVFIVGALLASAPTVLRFTGGKPAGGAVIAADTQSHSGAFRKYTWIGTVRMAKASPLFGEGIGSFSVTYPHRAITAFTGHAHNSYLQWAGETGVPGVLFLLTIFAAAAAFAAHILFLHRPAKIQAHEDGSADTILLPRSRYGTTAPGAAAETALFAPESARLLLTGLAASLLASLLHSLFDSDWYVTASALTLGAVVALLVGQARDIAPLATQQPRPLSKGMLGVGILVALLLLWRSYSVAGSALQAALAQQQTSAPQVIQDYRSAAASDPFDPEPELSLASVYSQQARTDPTNLEAKKGALVALQEAVRRARTGKTLYRLAQYYAANGDTALAIETFQQSKEREPQNLQTLRSLAEAQTAAGSVTEAATTYRDMIALESSPYGTVRAMPEFIEIDFASAHLGLADLEAQQSRWKEAANEYRHAADILQAYWTKRHDATYATLDMQNGAKRKQWHDIYERILTGWLNALNQSGDTAGVATVVQEQTRFHSDADQDALDRQKAQFPNGAGQ